MGILHNDGHCGLTITGLPLRLAALTAKGAWLTRETYVPYSMWSTLAAALSAFRYMS